MNYKPTQARYVYCYNSASAIKAATNSSLNGGFPLRGTFCRKEFMSGVVVPGKPMPVDVMSPRRELNTII